MSSEGSVTSTASRIRQFGLYRTIDARTDEFLRSSRRRQIRQGCACAAISTAITVTVVVSVILVYEYSINSESNVNKKLTVKPNWLGLINESDPTQTALKFEKKASFDRTTLKLLPILIKALNKNRYLEKIIEDYSSSSPSYEAPNETENYFQRNIFSNSNNWLKMPTSKVYPLDYKSATALFTRRPPAYSDYLSRIRKIRNYKRMLNNFNGVVSDKVSFSKVTKPVKPDNSHAETTAKTVTRHMKMNVTMPVRKKFIDPFKNEDIVIPSISKPIERTTKPTIRVPINKNEKQKNNKNKGNCKCPKNLGLLLNKLIENVKEIIPNIINKSSCNNKSKSEIHESHSATKSKIQENIIIPTTQQVITKSTTLKILLKITTPYPAKKEKSNSTTIKAANVTFTTTPQQNTSELPKVMSAHKNTTELIYISAINTTATETPTHSMSIVSSTTQSSNNILEQVPTYGTYDINDVNYEMSQFTNLQDKPVSSKILKKHKITTTTELINPIRVNSHSNEGSLSSESFLDSVAVVPNYKHPIKSVFKQDVYEDYYLPIRQNANDFDDLDVHSFELVKTKNVISPPIKNNRSKFRNNIKNIPLTLTMNNQVTKSKDADYINMRKMADLIYLPKMILKDNNNPDLLQIYENELVSRSNFTTRNDKETGLLKNVVKIRKSETLSKTHPQMLSNIETTQLPILEVDQSNEDTNEDEFADPEWPKNTEFAENNIKFNKSLYDDDIVTSPIIYESKSHDKINSLNSMMPSIRPIYLEIRRNGDWKPEDHADYDINLFNNIFDLPDT